MGAGVQLFGSRGLCFCNTMGVQRAQKDRSSRCTLNPGKTQVTRTKELWDPGSLDCPLPDCGSSLGILEDKACPQQVSV